MEQTHKHRRRVGKGKVQTLFPLFFEPFLNFHKHIHGCPHISLISHAVTESSDKKNRTGQIQGWGGAVKPSIMLLNRIMHKVHNVYVLCPRCAEGQLCPTEEGVWWQHWLVRACMVRHAEPQLILILFTHPCSYDDTLYSTVPSPSFACRAASIVTHTHTSAILRLKLCAAEELPLPQSTPVTQIKHITLEQVLLNGSLQGFPWSLCASARPCAFVLTTALQHCSSQCR